MTEEFDSEQSMISDSKVITRTRLTLKCINSFGQTNVFLEIGPKGLMSSERKKDGQPADGCVYFGTQKRGIVSGYSKVINDFKLPDLMKTAHALPTDLEKQRKERNRGRQFRIKYSKSNDQYMAKDLGIGLGCWVRLFSAIYNGQPHILKDNDLITLATYYILVHIEEPQSVPDQKELAKPILHLKVFGGPDNASVYVLDPNKQKQVIIGKSKDCDITINDMPLSKRHACFSFTNGQWNIQDGFQNLASKNGTYVFMQEDTPITEGMEIKVSEVYFRATMS